MSSAKDGRVTTEDTKTTEEPSAEDLAVALYHALVTLHPMYPTTTGPRGGIGGQAVTSYCHVIDPYGSSFEMLWNDVDETLRRFLRADERRGNREAFFARIKESEASA